MPTTINPLAYIIGAAEVYYRAVDATTLLPTTGPWTSIGSTVDDVVARVTQSTFNPSSTINGLDDLIALMDYRNGTGMEVEFTMAEIAGAKLALAIPGATSTTLATTTVGGGLSTTTTAATAIGATTIALTATTGLAVGDTVKIDTGSAIEYRVITAIASLNASFRDPLLQAHSSGVAVVEVVGDGKTEIISSTVRRLPASAYNDFALVAQSPSDYYELILYRGVSTTEAVEFAFGDETMAAVRVTIGARKVGSDLTVPSWKLRVPA